MEWFVNFGYVGLFIGTFIAGTVFPLSSELVLFGVLVAGCNPWVCLIIATLGNALGSMVSFGLGWLGKWEWLEKLFGVKKEKIEKQKGFVEKYGIWAALFSWAPVIGTVSVITLGFYKTRPVRTALLILLGCFIRFAFWIVLYVIYSDRLIQWYMNRKGKNTLSMAFAS